MAKKYIISEKRLLISASVTYHKELAKDHSKTRGGGLWDIVNGRLYFYGVSGDFGWVDKDDLIEALNNEISDRFYGMEAYYSKKFDIAGAIIHNEKIK